MLALDDLTTLALFVEVVEQRSFTAAAKAAGMAKATVSRRVAALERQLGLRLLRRSTRHVIPTEEGQRLFERSVELVATARAASEVLRESKSELSGVLRVSAPVVLTHRHLTAAVVDFLRAHRDVQIQLLPRAAPMDLVADEIDVALRIGNVSAPSLVVRRLATDHVIVVASQEYLKRSGAPRSLADLEKHSCLRLSWEAEHPRWRFRGSARGSALRLRGNLVASDATVVRDAALRGLGLAMLPSHVVAEEVRSGQLVRVLRQAKLPELPISVVYAERRHMPRRVRAFVDFIVARFAAQEWAEQALL